MSASIPVFSDRPKAASTPKLRALVKFPGNVAATTGISVEKTNGTYTFELDYSQFSTTSSVPISSTNYVLNYDTVTQVYTLIPSTNTSSATIGYVDGQDNLRVLKSGDTMSGNLTAPGLVINKSASGARAVLSGLTAGSTRWWLQVGDDSAESGGNIGSDFLINRFADAGTFIDTPISIKRSDGKVTMGVATASTSTTTGALVVTGGVGVGGTVNATAIKAANATLGTSTITGLNTVAEVAYAAPAQIGISFRPAADSGTPLACVFTNAAGTIVGSINTTASATAFATSSAAELKEDLKSFDAGHIIDDTKVYDFKWKSTGERAYGVIAQQAIEVYPTAVTHDEKEDWWGVDYSKYTPILLQELKTLRARVATLEAKFKRKSK